MRQNQGLSEVKDAQNIADIIVDPEGGSNVRDHWQKTSHALIVSTILHVLYSESEKTLTGVASFLANPALPIEQTLMKMKTTLHLGNKPHPVVASVAQEMQNKSETELSGVVSTAMSYLSLYRDPIVARNISKSDFMINDLMNSENPLSLYLVLPAGDIDRLMPLARMMINMASRRLTEASIGISGSPHKHKLLLLLDEFPALGCMPFFKKALGFVAGYNIKCMLVCQSYNNIYEHYGNKNSIFDNCHIRMTMAPNDNDTAREISTTLGQKTVKRHQVNVTGRRLAPFLSNISVADQETGRSLMTPDEVQKLPDDKVILMVSKNYPAILDKIFYFKDKHFKKRLFPAPELNEEFYIDCPPKSSNDWECTSIPKSEENEIESIKDEDVIFESDDSQSINKDELEVEPYSPEKEVESELDMRTCSDEVNRSCILGIGGKM
jgi:type IV secretion system protein VirD4